MLHIPCEHLVDVMMSLNIVNLPDEVVYKRWTKSAKDCVGISSFKNEFDINPGLVGQFVGFMHHCKSLSESAFKCGVPKHVRDTIDIMSARKQFLDSIRSVEQAPAMDVDPVSIGFLGNPIRVGTKGCGGTYNTAYMRGQS